MTGAFSQLVTIVGRYLPASAKGILLRKAVAIADETTRFRNGYISMAGSLANLRASGFSPGGIVDIGANIGIWTQEVAEIFPDAKIHMIEAQPWLASKLQEVVARMGGQSTFAIHLVGAEPKVAVPFFVIGTGSSVFEEVTDLRKTITALPMTRIDDLSQVRSLPRPLFLKLDVQGYELEVLKGAAETLASAEVVLMEVALLPYNVGAPLMTEVIAFMKERGFVPFDICGQLRRISDHALFQIDMIFVRSESQLRAHRRFSMFERPHEDTPS